MSLYGGVTLPGKPDLANVQRLDLLPMPMIRRMQRYGIAIDPPYFADLTSRLEKEMDEYRTDIACEIPPEHLDRFIAVSDDIDDWSPINVESGAQLAVLLFDLLKIGKGTRLKMTKGGDRISTGKKQMEVLKHLHPVVDMILKYRERSKLRNTYTLKLPKIAKFHPKGKCCPICELSHIESTYRIHTEITSTRTDTGRLASKNPNLQNIPSRTELGRAVRAGFIAPPGKRLVGVDLAQIELRMIGHCANETNMIRIFWANGDIHLDTAMRAFNIAADAVDKLLHRAPSKSLNFGIAYGLTEAGLYDQMLTTYATAKVPLPAFITVDWCIKFIRKWYALYPSVEPYMDTQHYRARRYEKVWDLFGRIRGIPEVRSCDEITRSAGLRQAGNMPIQSVAAGVMKLCMAMVEDTVLLPLLDNGLWCWPLLPVHDELIVECDEDYADTMCDLMINTFNISMMDQQTGRNTLRVPIGSDGHAMERWQKD